MDESEFLELRSELRRSGLAVVEAEVSAEWSTTSHDGARFALLDFLDLLETALRVRSRGAVEDVMGRLNEVIDPSSPLAGIVVELSDAETVATGRTDVDLLDMPDTSGALDGLSRLRAELAES